MLRRPVTAPPRRFGREGGYVLHTLTQTSRDALCSSLARAFKGECAGHPPSRVLSEAEAEGEVRGVVWRMAVLSRLTQMCGVRLSAACSFKVRQSSGVEDRGRGDEREGVAAHNRDRGRIPPRP